MAMHSWPQVLTPAQVAGLVVPPLVAAVVLLLLLRVVFKPRDGSFRLTKASPPGYGSMSIYSETESDAEDIIYAGEVAGDYSASWTTTFDAVFLGIVIVLGVVLAVTTAAYQPQLWYNGCFWLAQLVKVGFMLVVSTLGGLLCRFFCIVDATGYVMTTRNSIFKVNYSRKLQHFAAYLIPLLDPIVCDEPSTPLAMAWAYYCTLSCFLCVLKPIRERSRLCMLQFNGLDRPEDRPHTLKWLLGGNLLPGFALVVLFSSVLDTALVRLIVLVVCVGDGLAEPVGIACGKHRYLTSSCFSSRRYTRSFEGSAVVFLSALIFPVIMYTCFPSPSQLWLTMALLPPAVTVAEAKSPHTVDTPILILVAGTLLHLLV
ncbi:hypothetical protein ACHHYP_09005 [Achlya hypogyna]|uniref:Dolichol kinase n=1 Tax=Achlya hypogyna TaxID=1202772 RepID=A0A1V9ZJH2_ACHHY|nr:hypothetical protein ACHHYP_09005 [Achlya hypogyna]